MVEEKDWRLQNLLGLEGKTFTAARFEPQEDWDHEHCEGCWQKFADFGCPPDVIKGGFTADDGRFWVCPECFKAFRSEMKWTLVGDADQDRDSEN